MSPKLKAGPDRPRCWKRLGCLALAFVMVVPTLVFTPEGSFAQEQPRRNFLQRLFFGNYYPPPPRRQLRKARPRKNISKARVRRSVRPGQPEQPQVAIVEKVENARVVLVVGDFLGGGLAEGLTMSYAERPAVRVIDRTQGSSGFVRADYFDWPGEVAGMLEADKPAAVVVMIGSNDRQQMRMGAVREEKRTELWTKEYEVTRDSVCDSRARQERSSDLGWNASLQIKQYDLGHACLQ